MRFIVLLHLFLFSLFALEINVTDTKVSNGRTTLLEFKKTDDITPLNVVLGKKKFQVFKHPLDGDKYYALLPFSYYATLEQKKVKINYKQNGVKSFKSMIFQVIDGGYAKENLTVSKSKVNPKSEKVQKRISREYKEAMRIYNNVTQKSYISTPFIMPLDSVITSDFGKARVYNGSLKGYHSGTDFRAKVGTKIIASNEGKVVLTKDRFYSGGTVLIDHGQGIYTCYFHMSGFSVKEGDMVKKGQVIGLSGQSGRVTGPHLHFAVRINGVQVDPLQFITLMNKHIFLQKKGS